MRFKHIAGTQGEQLWACGCAICPSIFNVNKASSQPSKPRASAAGPKRSWRSRPLIAWRIQIDGMGKSCRNVYRCGNGLRVPESIAALISRLPAMLSRLSSTGPQSCRLRRVASPPPAHPQVLRVDDAAAPTRKIRARFCSDCLHRAARAAD